MEVYVARQPIFDTKNIVYAYELLYRQDEKNFFNQSIGSNVATSLLLMNSYYTFSIESLVGDRKAFINFDKRLIMEDIPKLLNKNHVVIELLEDIIPDDIFIKKVKELKAEGYIIAIDDYIEEYKYDELVHLSDIIKVDFFGNTKEQIVRIVRKWKPLGKILLAEKVETIEVFQWAKKIGFDLFQGYYFSKPSMVKGKGVVNSSFQYIRIMNKLSEVEPDFKAITSIIETDVNLSYKVLKLVNMNFTKSKQVQSINQALSMLGIRALEKWISLAMIENLIDDKPRELIKLSLTRAKFMELIGLNSKLNLHANEMMLIGILSVIDVLLEKPMDVAINELPLSNDIKAALLLNEGKYTVVYKLILHFEKGDFALPNECIERIGIKCENLSNYYIEAVKWADDIYKVLNS